MSRPVRIDIRKGGMTLRELGAEVGADYPATGKAVIRMAYRLKRDGQLRVVAEKIRTELSNVQTRPQSLPCAASTR